MMPNAALRRVNRPNSRDSPISRWPQATRKENTGAMAGVVKMANKSWKVLVVLRKPTMVKLGSKVWWEAA